MTIDATQYVGIVANDSFHPGRLHSLLIDPASVTSAQFMGYGDLDGTKCPVVRLFYENGLAENGTSMVALSPLLSFLCGFVKLD